MKIELLINFGGVPTNELRILPGIYDADDERLFGITEYLLDNGHAVVVDDDVPMTEFKHERPKEDFTFHNEIMRGKGRPVVPDEPETITPKPYDDMSLDELREELALRGVTEGDVVSDIKAYHTFRRVEIVEWLERNEAREE